MTTNENTALPISRDDEIDLIHLARNLWKGKRTILVITIVSAILGLVIALLSPRAYTTSTTMVPQVSSKTSNLGGLSSLAAMAGFSLDMSSGAGAMSPVIYPQILQSVPFQLELMNTPFAFSESPQPVSIYTYYTSIAKPNILKQVKKYTIGLPFVILKAMRGNPDQVIPVQHESNIISITKDQDEVRKILREDIILSTDTKEGYLTLSVTMPQAYTAAEVALKVQEMLQRYISEFKIAKASDQLRFIEERYNEKKAEYENAQARLASFRDRNRNLTSALARTEEERLTGEFTIAYNVYNELAKQLEQARIQVKEDSPVLSVIKPVVVPIEKSQPKMAMILAIALFIGLLAGIATVLVKNYWADLKAKFQAD